MYLRRLFCGKIGQLGRSRKDLISKLPSESIGISHASDKLEEVTNLAERLRANGNEEYRTYMQFASSLYRGVSLLLISCTTSQSCFKWLLCPVNRICGTLNPARPRSMVMMTQLTDVCTMLCTCSVVRSNHSLQGDPQSKSFSSGFLPNDSASQVAQYGAHMQVLTAKQYAIGIVHSYPWIPEKHRLLELLASKRGVDMYKCSVVTDGQVGGWPQRRCFCKHALTSEQCGWSNLLPSHEILRDLT